MSYEDTDAESVRMKMVGRAGENNHLINISLTSTKGHRLELQFYSVAHLVKNKDFRN